MMNNWPLVVNYLGYNIVPHLVVLSYDDEVIQFQITCKNTSKTYIHVPYYIIPYLTYATYVLRMYGRFRTNMYPYVQNI